MESLDFVSIRTYNRSVTTSVSNKLKILYANLPPGSPVTSDALSQMGISADLAVHYARSGWLHRLARGIYCRNGEALDQRLSLILLQQKIQGLHVGGKSALEWHGVRQYVSQHSNLHLYGWTATHLPEWFTERFPSEYHRKRLFNEELHALRHIDLFENKEAAPLVSSPERALLELLSEVGVRQPLQEAREIFESCYNLRVEVLQSLLTHCKSIKTVRLCVQLAQELEISWAKKLDADALPTGNSSPWVSNSKHGLLILKP